MSSQNEARKILISEIELIDNLKAENNMTKVHHSKRLALSATLVTWMHHNPKYGPKGLEKIGLWKVMRIQHTFIGFALYTKESYPQD